MLSPLDEERRLGQRARTEFSRARGTDRSDPTGRRASNIIGYPPAGNISDFCESAVGTQHAA